MTTADEPKLPSGALGRLAAMVGRIIPARFVKFCVVGLSGMVVNMFVLLVLADMLGMHTNIAAAISIEISIVTNFLLNDRWTFADQVEGARGFWTRLLRFHLVSAVGATLQWSVFVIGNYLLADIILGASPASLVEAVTRPPQLGPWKYLSQFVGIGLAAVWNFFANLLWTWRRASPEPG